MALTQAYVNEVLNNLTSTVVVDEQTWPELIRLLKFEGRDLTTLEIGRMKLRQAKGGYDGLVTSLSELLKENESLREQMQVVTAQEAEVAHVTDETNTVGSIAQLEHVHG